MSSVGAIDPVSARNQAEGQEGPRSPVAREKRELSARPPVEFGGALSHMNEVERAQRVDPAAIAERTARPDVQRARDKLKEPPEPSPENSARAQRFAEDQAAYDQRQVEKAGQRLDIEV